MHQKQGLIVAKKGMVVAVVGGASMCRRSDMTYEGSAASMA
jgi:hypothetical protein